MWEAWWQGDPYLNVERLYRDTVFGAGTNDDASYDRAVGDVIQAAAEAPYVILQSNAKEAARFERIMRAQRPTIELVTPNDDEHYIIGKQ
jgi:hypothetical protein